MTLIDEYTRKCLSHRVDRQLTSTDVLSLLSETTDEEGVPSYIRSDNGSEFIANQVERWLPEKDIKAIYIDVFKDSLQYGARFPVFQPYHNGVLSQLHRTRNALQSKSFSSPLAAECACDPPLSNSRGKG